MTLTLNIDQGRKVFAFGETVYDIVLEEGVPVSGCAGGAMLNTCISLGRLGIPVSLLGTVGDDEVGRYIQAFLLKNGVDITYLLTRQHRKTSLALAFLDHAKEANYQFYKDDPFPSGMTLPVPASKMQDIFLFGSFFSLLPETREQVNRLIRNAKATSSLVMYDPNFRVAHLSRRAELLPQLIHNISSADLVRGSADDFFNLFATRDPGQVYRHIRDAGCGFLIYTMGDAGVHFFYPSGEKFFKTKAVQPVSTIGAGDSFNAGLIAGIISEGITTMKSIQQRPDLLFSAIRTGMQFGRRVCRSYQNYISKSYADKIILC